MEDPNGSVEKYSVLPSLDTGFMGQSAYIRYSAVDFEKAAKYTEIELTLLLSLAFYLVFDFL